MVTHTYIAEIKFASEPKVTYVLAHTQIFPFQMVWFAFTNEKQGKHFFKRKTITVTSESFLRKAMMNLDSILKSRDITLQTKIHIVKAIVPSSYV